MSDTNELNKIGRDSLASIRDMVAACELDWDRLAELRNERDMYRGSPDEWAEGFADDAAELAELEEQAGDCDEEEAEQRIQEDPLCIQFRSGWESNPADFRPEEVEILLTTGGPAVRIIGNLSDGTVTRACLQVQDLGTPWTDYYEPGIGDVLLSYCRHFCFEF